MSQVSDLCQRNKKQKIKKLKKRCHQLPSKPFCDGSIDDGNDQAMHFKVRVLRGLPLEPVKLIATDALPPAALMHRETKKRDHSFQTNPLWHQMKRKKKHCVSLSFILIRAASIDNGNCSCLPTFFTTLSMRLLMAFNHSQWHCTWFCLDFPGM